jgi:MFS family permease
MPLFFLSTFFLNLALAYLNVSYIPFLSLSGVPAGIIFVIPLMNTATQVATYVYIKKFVAKFGRAALGESSIFLIMLLYLTIAASGILLRGIPFILLNLACYGLVGLMFALWNSSTAASLFSEMDPDQRGTIMGGYIGLSSLGALVGSFLSGATSFYIGYAATFVAAALLMGVALLLRARFNASREVSEAVESVGMSQVAG